MADYNINAVTRRKVFSGSAGTGPYSFTFEVLDQNDLAVYKNATKLTLTVDYTVTVNANGTGDVNLVLAATSSDTVTIIGARDIERTTDFVTAGDLRASALNEQLDALTIFDQQIAEENKRQIIAPVEDPEHVDDGGTLDMTLPAKDTRKGKYLAFNSTTGNPEAGASSDDVATLAAITDDIATLADIEDGTDATDAIQTVAGISSNVSTVAGISSNVTTVAGISSDVTAVAGDATDIGTVAGLATEIGRLGTADAVADMAILGTADVVSDLNTLATSAIVTDLDALADIATELDALGDITSNITTVAGISANVTTVAGISSNVTTVAGVSSDVSTVAGISTDVAAVEDIAANVTTVAGVASDVTTVAGISANTTTVAGISANVTTVAGISSDVTTVAGDAADISTVAGISSNVTTVATNNANVTTVASNITGVNSFAERYRVGSADPTTSLDEGDLAYNSTDNQLKFYNGSSWNSITAGIANVSEDTTPQLGGDLDLNNNNITGTGGIPAANLTGTVANARLDAELQALAGLTSAADKGIQFTGSGTAATYDLTAAGKALLDDADASAQRTTLGLGTIATQAANSVNIDGGAVDGVTIGTNSAVTDLRVDNLKMDANTISSTNTNGDITLDPNGTGNVLIGNYEFDADQSVGSGQDDYVLTYDNSTGHISLEAAAAAGATGGGSDEIFYENGQNVTTNYTITNGKNAMSAGPITIDSGVTVTVGTGETWTVV